MGIFKNIGKLGILVSFVAAVAYELTGSDFMKAFSLVTGILSLVILSSYLSQLRHLGKARDVLHYFRLLK